jgi:hypothetical protein
VSRSNAFASTLVFTLFFLLAVSVLGQEATPDASPAAGATKDLDLAAIVLVADELPAGFSRGIDDTYTPGDLYGIAYAPHVSNEDLVAAGYLWDYEAYYTADDESASISVSIDEYATSEGAIAGFAVFAEQTRPAPYFTVLSTTDLPGPAVGEDPKTFSLTTYEYPNGRVSRFVDASFRMENLIARVTYERFEPQAASGTPATMPGTTAALTPEQDEMVEQVEILAATLASRIESVRAGESPSGTNLELAQRVLPLAALPNAWNRQSWEGYRDAAGILGRDGALADRFAADFRSGYGRTVALGTGSSARPPYLSVAVAQFATPEAALALLEAIRQAPADLPATSRFAGSATPTIAADPTVTGAEAALALTSSLDDEVPEAPADSARVVFVAGPRLVAVDVRGADSAEAALAAAEDLAAQQAACLMADGPCSAVTAPALRAGGG